MSSWQKPVVDLINRFGGSTASLWPLLEVMTVLPEEVNSRSLRYIKMERKSRVQYIYKQSFIYLLIFENNFLKIFITLYRLGANRRQHILLELNASADTVTEFLVSRLKIYFSIVSNACYISRKCVSKMVERMYKFVLQFLDVSQAGLQCMLYHLYLQVM